MTSPNDDEESGVGPAPPETVALWIERVQSMDLEQLADFEARTFRQWFPSSLGELRRAIDQRRKELAG